jgi:hypothetical protein
VPRLTATFRLGRPHETSFTYCEECRSKDISLYNLLTRAARLLHMAQRRRWVTCQLFHQTKPDAL